MSQSFHDHFSGVASRYADFRPQYPAALLDYLATLVRFAEIAPPAFRMETIWTLDQLLGYFGTWSATNRYLKATGRNPIEPLAANLKRVWGDPNSPQQVVWPLAARIGRR